MERFGITNIRKSLAITLSGGEKRRLTIARALCTDPTILLLDEPFSGVDPRAVADIQKIITQLRATRMVLLFSSPTTTCAKLFTSRTGLISWWRAASFLEGSAQKIANDPGGPKILLGRRVSAL